MLASAMDLSLTPTTIGCLALVMASSAVQVAVGAGLSVVCGPFLMLQFGPAFAVPALLVLNLLVSVIAAAFDCRHVRWADAGVAAAATLAGCLLGSVVPAMPVATLRVVTAGVLFVVALPRPPAPERPLGAASASAGIALAGLMTGALTVWTATPSPLTPIALTRAGRDGSEVRRTMQPTSVVGRGAALAWCGGPAVVAGPFAALAGAAVAGIGVGLPMRLRIGAGRVVILIRAIAAAAAVVLVASALP